MEQLIRLENENVGTQTIIPTQQRLVRNREKLGQEHFGLLEEICQKQIDLTKTKIQLEQSWQFKTQILQK